MSITYYRNFKTQSKSDSAQRWKCNRQKRNMPYNILIAEPSLETSSETEELQENQKAFGFVYHSGPQMLRVTVPGDVIPVRFDSHTILQRLSHDDNLFDILVAEPGIYEISYSVSVQSVNSAHVAFAVQTDGQTVDGSVTAKLINTQGCVFSAAVITELKPGSLIRLVMTSGTVVSAETEGNGVSASMIIKKLD